MVLSSKRRSSSCHFIHDSTDTPKVGFSVVFLIAQNFRGHIEWRAAESFSHSSGREISSKAKVSDSENRDADRMTVGYSSGVWGL